MKVLNHILPKSVAKSPRWSNCPEGCTELRLAYRGKKNEQCLTWCMRRTQAANGVVTLFLGTVVPPPCKQLLSWDPGKGHFLGNNKLLLLEKLGWLSTLGFIRAASNTDLSLPLSIIVKHFMPGRLQRLKLSLKTVKQMYWNSHCPFGLAFVVVLGCYVFFKQRYYIA